MRNLSQNLRDKSHTELKKLRNKAKKIIKEYEENYDYFEDHEKIMDFENWKQRTKYLLAWTLPPSDSRLIDFNEIFFPSEEQKSSGKIYWPDYRNLEDNEDVQIHLSRAIGILSSIIEDIKTGLLDNIENLVSGEIFDSILEAGKYLLSEDHKDAAAIYGRITLEQTLKKLCSRQNPPIAENKKTMVLNDLLWKAKALTKPEWSQNQAWLHIGNKAAHGEWEEYDADKVERMLDGITAFIAKKL